MEYEKLMVKSFQSESFLSANTQILEYDHWHKRDANKCNENRRYNITSDKSWKTIPNEGRRMPKLRTRSLLCLRTRGIAKKMGELRRDLDLVFFHRFLVKPQQTSVVHVGK